MLEEVSREAARQPGAPTADRYNNALRLLINLKKCLWKDDGPSQSQALDLIDQCLASPVTAPSPQRPKANGLPSPGAVAIAAFCIPLAAYLLLNLAWLWHKHTFTERRIADLSALNQALARYHADHGHYPKSILFDGRASFAGASKTDWIEGLVPGYIPELPRDPRQNDDQLEQYLYMSDGTDYKLIAHYPGWCERNAQKYPGLRFDPYDDCQFFGFWTRGAENWRPVRSRPQWYTQRLSDLARLKAALDTYYAAQGAYPVSRGTSALFSNYGYSGDQWIAHLAPGYIDVLPKEPRGTTDPEYQYQYISDGKDYKLVVGNPEDLPRAKQEHPEMMDPARQGKAYGYWTKGAASW